MFVAKITLMQKTLLSLIILFSTFSGFAQINKGQFLVGGSGSFYNKKISGIETTNFTLSPNVGYFFLDKLAVGLNANLGYTQSKYSINQKTDTKAYGVSPFVRYYVLPASNKVNFFAQASYGWGKGITSYTTNDYKFKLNTTSFAFAGGPVFFITPNVAVELSIGYGQNDSKYKNGNNENKLKDKNFQAGVGFQIHLGKGKK